MAFVGGQTQLEILDRPLAWITSTQAPGGDGGETRPLYLVIDRSGSMSSNLATVEELLRELISPILPNTRVSLILFNDKATVYSSDYLRTQGFPQFKAGSTTDFTEALNALLRSFDSSTQAQDASVLFLTDGRHNRPTSMEKYMRLFWRDPRTQALTFHAVGFGRDHDLETIKRLVLDAPTESTYLYAPSRKDLAAALEPLLDLTQSGLNLTIRPIGRTFRWTEAQQTMTFELPDQLETLELVNAATNEPLAKLELPETQPPPELVFNYLIEQVERIGLTSDDQAEKHRALKRLDQAAEAHARKNRKCLGRYLDFKEALSQVYRVLAGGVRDDQQEQLAQLLSARTVRIRGRGKARRRDALIVEGEKDLLERQAKLQQARAELSEGFKDREPEIEHNDFFTCLLSTQTPTEALSEGDVMGLTFLMTRQPGTVVKPELVRILQVNTQVMTWETFRQLVSRLDQVNGQDATELHGAFEKVAEPMTLIQDRVIEPFNAILPLYLSKEHWSVAQHIVPSALGWACLLDERAYHPNQWSTLPFLIWARLKQQLFQGEEQNERRKVYFEALDRTCQEVPLDRDQLFKTLSQPIDHSRPKGGEDPQSGLGDHPNLGLLIAQLDFLQAHGHEIPECAGPRLHGSAIEQATKGLVKNRLRTGRQEQDIIERLLSNPKRPWAWIESQLEQLGLPRLEEDRVMGIYYQTLLNRAEPVTEADTDLWLEERRAEKIRLELQRQAGDRLTREMLQTTRPEDLDQLRNRHIFTRAFGNFLQAVRTGTDGLLVAPQAKLDYLKTMGWTPGKKNLRSFRRHCV